MAETSVFDGRRGLTEEALQELRRADHVMLALKDRRTGVIGYWAKQPDQADQPSDRFGVVVIQGESLYAPLRGGTVEAPRVLIHIEDAPRHHLWGRLISMLRPGDVLQVKAAWSSSSQYSPTLEVHHGTGFHASLSLGPKAEAKQPRSRRAV